MQYASHTIHMEVVLMWTAFAACHLLMSACACAVRLEGTGGPAEELFVAPFALPRKVPRLYYLFQKPIDTAGTYLPVAPPPVGENR